jgi:hypothetical protein
MKPKADPIINQINPLFKIYFNNIISSTPMSLQAVFPSGFALSAACAVVITFFITPYAVSDNFQ